MFYYFISARGPHYLYFWAMATVISWYSVLIDAGAIELLSNLNTMDWTALYSGRICIDEVPRIRRIVRRDLVALPYFVRDLDRYRRTLADIARVNGIVVAVSPSAGVTTSGR